VSSSLVIEELEKEYLKKEVPVFNIGDTIRVSTRIVEGEKERIQIFSGTVIAKKGSGLSETFTIYRNAYGSNMDRVFLLHSPRITSIEVVRPGKIRRAKLYYLRGRTGKSAKVREKYVAGGNKKAALAPELPPEEPTTPSEV
jgi:large subunit ribosomal protein L19